MGGPLLIKKGPGRSGTNTLTISAFHRFGMKREVKKRPQGQPRTQEAYYFDVIDGSLFDLCAKQMPWVRGCLKGSVYSTTIRIRIYNRVEVQVGKKRITPRGLLRDHHKLDSNALWFFYQRIRWARSNSTGTVVYQSSTSQEPSSLIVSSQNQPKTSVTFNRAVLITAFSD